MNKKINILHLEDSKKDSELIHSIIETGEIEHDYSVVDNEKDFSYFLQTKNIDLILSDYSVSGYNGNEALKVARENYFHIPFIFVSETIGEAGAIDAMLNGATDYVLKNKLERLVPAIKRAICEHEKKIKQKQTEIALKIVNRELLFQNKQKEKQIAELIIAKEKAEESDWLKSAFLANMSYELCTPLNSIILFSELMSDPKYDHMQQLKFAHMINDSGTNLLAIIMDILEISKIEAGQLHINKQLLSVNKLITNIYSEFLFRVNEKGIEFKLDDSNFENEILIKSDLTKLKQILANFINNAIKFTNEGSIEIGFKTVGDFVQFHVTDSGVGIPKEFHEQIFQRFQLNQSTLNRRLGGNGLGLAISKNLVELLSGVIWIESELGKGSTFYFLIPISDNSSMKTKRMITNRKASMYIV